MKRPRWQPLIALKSLVGLLVAGFGVYVVLAGLNALDGTARAVADIVFGLGGVYLGIDLVMKQVKR